MKEIIDLLKINGLENDSEIEHKIFHNWSIGQIKIFVEQFNEIIDNSKSPLHTSPFSFMPNSSMTAQHFFCPEWDCRLNRVDKLSRFAVFYSDLIMFPNYFSYYDHLSGRLTQHEELILRYNFIGDIKIINKIKPLLNAGLIKFISPLNPGVTLCPTCTAQISPEFKMINERFKKNIKLLSRKCLPQVKGTIKIIEQTKRPHAYYNIELTGLGELTELGEEVIQIEQSNLPKSLLKIVENIPRDELVSGVTISASDLEKSKFIQEDFERIIMDLWTKYFLCKTSNLDIKYLTDREIDRYFIDIMTQNQQILNYNQIVHDNILCQLPILNELPFETMLNVRQNEYDSFLVFRDSINSAIKECLASDIKLTKPVAQDIYEDIIMPKLNILNSTIKKIQNSHFRKARKEILTSTGLFTFGVFSLFLAPAAASIPLSLAGTELIKGIKSISNTREITDEIHNDNCFFYPS